MASNVSKEEEERRTSLWVQHRASVILADWIYAKLNPPDPDATDPDSNLRRFYNPPQPAWLVKHEAEVHRIWEKNMAILNDPSGGGKNGTERSEPSTPAKKGGRAREAVAEALAERTYKDSEAQRIARDVEGLKQYALGPCLGKGASGTVHQALDTNTGRQVAIKYIKTSDLPKNELQTIQLEVDLLKNLLHDNIVKYHGFTKSRDYLFIILEYCEGGSLHRICKDYGKFPEGLVAVYLQQVLLGLLYLHEQGVIHRDIKGANLLTTKDGRVKLADFGVATRHNVQEATVVGTPYWMAPEVIELSGPTTASDIWSLGCTVIELLDGKPPHHTLQPMQALFRIVNDDHPPLPEGASPVVRDFLMQCFQKDPNLRVSAKKLLKHPWIANARRDPAIVTNPPNPVQAIKEVQEWNEALRSPDHDSVRLRRSSRVGAFSPLPTRSAPISQFATPNAKPSDIKILKSKPNPDAFRSPDMDNDDVWDADFDSSINSGALRLPHLKPHDNADGLFSMERLKSLATFDSILDFGETDEPLKLNPAHFSQPDPLETVRPWTPQKSGDAGKGKASKPLQLKTQLPRAQFGRARPASSGGRKVSINNPNNVFRERSEEDYSDLLPSDGDELVFDRKIRALRMQDENSLSPKLFDISDLTNTPKANQGSRRAGGSLRHNGSPAEARRVPLARSRSDVAIQKYAEDDDEDPEDFLDVITSSARSDSGSERSTLMLSNSKTLNGTTLLDDEDDDDPFASMEADFDALNDMETNAARDRHAKLVSQVEKQVASFKPGMDEDTIFDAADQLMQLLIDTPDLRSVIVSAHGMLPILEMLENFHRNRDIVLRLLKIVNMIIFENSESQESLCFVGGIPIVTKFAHANYSKAIRLEAAAFVRQMYQSSTLTLQMFISCGGLHVLVKFLEEDLETERDLVLIGVNGIWSTFELHGPTPKNDFCRILARSTVLYPLSLVLNKLLDEKGEVARIVEGRIVNIFLFFSQAENFVKEHVADRMVIKMILKDLRRMQPQNQITMLKFIKNLSMLATTHDPLQNSNAIEVLTDLLGSTKKSQHFRELSNQILNIMYNLCRLSTVRQEDAALNGIIPLLQQIVKTEWPLKEFALPILCDMAHSSGVCRKLLWQNKGLQFYISLLADKYWQVTALDAILVWLGEETARVEQYLLESSFSSAIVDSFANTDVSPDAFENFLEPLQKLLRLSPSVAATLAHRDLFSLTAQKLNSKKAVVRLNLLRVVRSICDASEQQETATLVRTCGLYTVIEKLSHNDPAILVKELASELLRSCDVSARQTLATSRSRHNLRRSSSATLNFTPPSLMTSTTAPTPQRLRSGGNTSSDRDYYDSNVFDSTRGAINRTPKSASIIMTPSSSVFRPVSRDGHSADRSLPSHSQYTDHHARESLSNMQSSTSSSAIKSRLPRQSSSRTSRLGPAGQKPKEENVTPTPTLEPRYQVGGRLAPHALMRASTMEAERSPGSVARDSPAEGGSRILPRRRRQTSTEIGRR